nr:MAG TPA: hypothetical protein [Caudoviricetes sp.]
MIIDYKKMIVKLIRKSSKNQASDRDINKLIKLEEWYFTALK